VVPYDVTKVGRIALSEELEPEAISRRSVLSLLGLSGALGLAAPSLLLTVSAAEARAIPPAFNQADKPLPGEGGAARTSPQLDKPIPAGEAGTRTRGPRRKRLRERRKRRSEQRGSRQPGSPEYKPR
jgi:hypothetical protein